MPSLHARAQDFWSRISTGTETLWTVGGVGWSLSKIYWPGTGDYIDLLIHFVATNTNVSINGVMLLQEPSVAIMAFSNHAVNRTMRCAVANILIEEDCLCRIQYTKEF